KRRLTHPERSVGTRELRAREVQIERARLTEHTGASLAFANGLDGAPRAEMDEIDRRLRRRCELDRLGDGLYLGLDRSALWEVLDAGPPGGVQHRGPCGDDRVVLGMDRDQCASICGGSQQKRVVVTALDEPR